MKFLVEEFNQELEDSLRLKYEESILEVFELNKDNVLKVIDYLKDIGVNNIEELILYKLEFFTKDIDVIIKRFNEYNIGEVVDSINEDITNIDNI